MAEHLDRAKRPLCMHAYALSRRGAQRVLDSMLPQTDNGDVMVANMVIADKLRACVACPPPTRYISYYALRPADHSARVGSGAANKSQ